jgi:large subunit ribosomal protein L25
MSEQLTLPAEQRERAGKGASRELRRTGRVPAVIYGDKKTPLSVHVDEKTLAKALSTGHFMNTVVMIDAAGTKHRTLPKDVQFHPVSSRPIHVDFLRIGEHSTVTVAIPVRFDNEEDSPGLKRGGVLNIVRHDVELMAPADHIPEELVVDLTGLEIGDTIRISSITLPAGVESAIDRDVVVATVAGSSAQESDDAAEAAEGEGASSTEESES